MRAFLGALTAWALSATLASAQMMGVLGGPFAAASSYTGPGDVTTFTAWYSVARSYSAAYAASQGLAFNARNSTSAEQCDFPVTTAAAIGAAKNCTSTSNGVSLATFCLTGGCTVDEVYDETGGGRHLLEAVTADQPALTAVCNNGLPCVSTNSASSMLQSSANFTPATGVVSLAGVINRATGIGQGVFLGENSTSGTTGNRLAGQNVTANGWTTSGGTSGSITATAADATWHAGTVVQNGASSVLAIDGTETTGTITGSTTAAPIYVRGGASTTIEESEWGFADNVAWSSTVRTNLCHNMRLYYATAGTC